MGKRPNRRVQGSRLGRTLVWEQLKEMGFARGHQPVTSFFVLFGQTSWQTGRWKGWGLGWAWPGKTRGRQARPISDCFPQVRELVENS